MPTLQQMGDEVPDNTSGVEDEAAFSPMSVSVFEYLENLIYMAVIVVLLCTFVFRIVNVDGQSMLPTLENGDFLVSTHVLYEAKKGDIVVITQPNEIAVPLIKRIIATQGDILDVDFESGVLYLNGDALEESYINEPTYYCPPDATQLPITVPEGMVFAMGDNRNHSSDSRDARVGLIDTRYIMGRTVLRLFPLNKIGVLHE